MTLKRLFVGLACALALGLTHAHARRQNQAGPADAPVRRPPAVNTAPFVRLAEQGRMLAESGRLGHDTTLDLVATAELGDDGSLKPETARFEWREAGDKDVAEFARQFVTAVGESGMLAALRGSAKTVRITARLDRRDVALGLETEFASEPEATRLATGYDVLVTYARLSKSGTAEGTLYKALKFASEGKVFRLSFEMPKETVAKTVAEMLDGRAAAPDQH